MNIPIWQYLQLLRKYLQHQSGRVFLLALLLVSGIGLQLYSPQVLRKFIDTATSGGPGAALPRLALIFMGTSLLNQLLQALARYVGETVAWTATNDLRADLAAHCLRLDLSFHKARTPGEMVERIDGDVSALSNFFSQFFIDVAANAGLMVGVLALLFREEWRVGLGLSLFAGITLWVLTALRRWAVPIWSKQRQSSAEFYGFLGEQLAGMEDIHSSGATGFVMRRYYEILRTVLRLFVKSGMAGGAMWASSLAVFAIGNAVAFALGAWLWKAGITTIGTVYLIFHYTDLLRRPIEQIRMQLQDLQRAGASIERVVSLLQTHSPIDEGGSVPLPEGSLSVDFAGVSFGYEADDLVLRDLGFALKPGRVLGLLGRTGSGKSTVARMLLRFYDPTGGEIRLGGVPLRQTPLSGLRNRVGFVTQDVQLFAATVRDNLTFFNPEISDTQILIVLAELGLSDWLGALPQGLDSLLDSGNGGLSAGEAQLLAFARVFLDNPGLVILDEASSRLDPATEHMVERAVDRLLAGRTGIIIAHRLTTVQRADEIMILEAGRISEHGDRLDLAANPGSRFARLLQTGLEEVLA